jgi:hypothetical protein
VTTVEIVHVVPRPGAQPDGIVRIGQFLVVLADATADSVAARRALALWLRVPGGGSLWRLVERPAANPVMAGVLEETAARLLDAAGVTVIAVDLQVTDRDATELSSDTVTARVELGITGGTSYVTVSAGYGLALAAASGAPVRLADVVIERLAVPVHDDDLLTPFLPAAAVQRPARDRPRWRFEPRNLTFTDGLDRWELFGDAEEPHHQDYSSAAGSRSVTLASAVPEPQGSAVLVQTIFADDYRSRTVTFRGELRTRDVAGNAALYLASQSPAEPPVGHLSGRGARSLPATGSSDWTRHEVALPISGDAGLIRFGLSLTGAGRVDLRNAELATGG